MSAVRHAVTVGNQCRQNSNLTRVEEFPQSRRYSSREEGSSVAPLRGQLALEYRLQSLCQRLLESYKDQRDWAAVGQVAQSLVTNTQRVSLLKERLLGGNCAQFDQPSRRSLQDEPAGGSRSLLALISEADGEEEEPVGDEEETGSESEGSVVGKAFEGDRTAAFPLRGVILEEPDQLALAESLSPPSSAVDYETASQHSSTSEIEPETSTTGLESSETKSKTDSHPSLVQQLSSSSTTPSPIHSSCSVGRVTPPLYIPQDLPPPPTVQGVSPVAAEQEDSGPEGTEEREGATREEREGEPNCGVSVMDTVKPGEEGGVGYTGAEVADTNYVEMHLGGVRTEQGLVVEGGRERGEEGEGGRGENGVYDQPLGESSDSGCGEDGSSFPRELFCVVG